MLTTYCTLHGPLWRSTFCILASSRSHHYLHLSLSISITPIIYSITLHLSLSITFLLIQFTISSICLFFLFNTFHLFYPLLPFYIPLTSHLHYPHNSTQLNTVQYSTTLHHHLSPPLLISSHILHHTSSLDSLHSTPLHCICIIGLASLCQSMNESRSV